MTTMRTSLLPLVLCSPLLWACGSGSSPVPDPLADDAFAGSTGLEEDSSSDAADDPMDDPEPEERLDVPAVEEMTCQKVDFLFVIDNSGSMSDEQERLVDGFPGFIESIEESIEQYDYHLMVVTVDAQPPALSTDACDGQFGAGRISTAEGLSCGLGGEEGGTRYADAQSEDLSEVFECMAAVGTEGSGHEMPIWSMAQALTEQTFPGGCNEGFLRDDAILVVTFITDEEDDADFDSPGGPELWKEVLVSAKHGDEGAIVMLGLLGDTGLPDGVCQPFDGGGQGAQAAPRLRRFVESFPRGSWTSVCEDDYAPFFNEAVADIGEACAEFTPPG